jgi:hypothetical protein
MLVRFRAGNAECSQVRTWSATKLLHSIATKTTFAGNQMRAMSGFQPSNVMAPEPAASCTATTANMHWNSRSSVGALKPKLESTNLLRSTMLALVLQ